jgi:hypothetical protein
VLRAMPGAPISEDGAAALSEDALVLRQCEFDQDAILR